MRRRFYSRGFTLMEVLVAISIFALIGVASYRVLSSVMQTNERIAAHSEQMRSVNRAFWLLQQDIEQLLKRNVKDISADNPNAENYLLVQNDNELPLQLTRGGRANPLGLPRSSMQRVAYAVGHHPDYEKSDSPHYHEERSYLLRYTWPMLDGSGGKEQAQVQIVLPDIESMTINVLTEQGQQTAWPVEGINDPPLALQLEFTLQDGSSLKRSYKIW
ncbi:MAG TPA: type II secretion system minor pseudopilin GspJ [Spongiibacteraceae bacterium]